MIFSKSLGWWYWLVTVFTLAISLFVWSPAIWVAFGITLLQILHFAIRGKSLATFPIQVRTAWLIMLVAGIWPPLVFLHWIQLVGTTAMVSVNYCLLARCLSLLPWNRRESLSWRLVYATLLARPYRAVLCILPGDRSIRRRFRRRPLPTMRAGSPFRQRGRSMSPKLYKTTPGTAHTSVIIMEIVPL